MNTFAILATLALVLLSAEARITSLGLDTAAGVRSGLPDKAFKIDPENGVAINNPNFRVRIADLSNFPALAGTDTQTQVVRVILKAGKPFIPHYHPRGTEILNAVQGKFRVTFTFEGLNPRTVTNVINAGQSTVFPQGLIHTTTCISKKDCIFVSNFNTADPGLIPVNV